MFKLEDKPVVNPAVPNAEHTSNKMSENLNISLLALPHNVFKEVKHTKVAIIIVVIEIAKTIKEE